MRCTAGGGKTCPQIDSKKRVFSSQSGTVPGPGLSHEAAFVQDYRTVGWRRINKVRMTVSSSPPRPWKRLRGLSVILPRDQAASDSGHNPFTQAAVIKIWNADVELGYLGLHCTAEVDCRYREREVCEGGKVKIRISNATLELLTYFMQNFFFMVAQPWFAYLLIIHIDMYFFSKQWTR